VSEATAYFDPSALVKLYLREPHSVAVAELFGSLLRAASHEIAFVEVRAALAAANRGQRLPDAQHAISVSSFGRDWTEGISAVATDTLLLERAAELAEGFALRGYDAVHLASAERVRLGLPATRFVSFDRNLNRAAKLLGFALPDFVPLA
jgi:predicted nucleic acid-binding protein